MGRAVALLRRLTPVLSRFGGDYGPLAAVALVEDEYDGESSNTEWLTGYVHVFIPNQPTIAFRRSSRSQQQPLQFKINSDESMRKRRGYYDWVCAELVAKRLEGVAYQPIRQFHPQRGF